MTGDSVVIVDFKTSGRPPASAAAIPPATLAQLAVYRALVGAIYPGRRIRTLAIYTATLARFEPDAAELDAALATMTG